MIGRVDECGGLLGVNRKRFASANLASSAEMVGEAVKAVTVGWGLTAVNRRRAGISARHRVLAPRFAWVDVG